MIPLNLVQLYWNQTFMFELIKSGNELARLNLQALAFTLPGAHIGQFNKRCIVIF